MKALDATSMHGVGDVRQLVADLCSLTAHDEISSRVYDYTNKQATQVAFAEGNEIKRAGALETATAAYTIPRADTTLSAAMSARALPACVMARMVR